MSRRIRHRLIAALAAAGLATAGTAAATSPAHAAPSASITSTYLWLADPFPFGSETVHITVEKPGVLRLTLSKMCSSINPPVCAGFSLPMNVAWLNTVTGQSGSVVVPQKGLRVTTGRGTIALGAMFGVPATPGAAIVNA